MKLTLKSTSIRRSGLFLAALFAFLVGFGSAGSAREFVVGMHCDRSGPTQTIGPFLCTGFHDYIKLFNKNGGLPGGHTIRVLEIDHGYEVPRGVEAYARFKTEGVMSVALYGTPHTKALTKSLHDDHILGTSAGFGDAAAANGTKFPYLFPMAATYWSQAATGVKFVMDRWDKSRKPKIAYIFYDNPAGREPLPILETLQKQLGFELRTFAVPPPGIDMRPQVLDIARRYRADWVLAHLFGRAPGVAIKEFARVRFPRERMIGFVWAGGESDIRVAGWDTAEGYYNMQFAWVGSNRQNLNHPLLQQIGAMYTAEGRDLPEEMDNSVYYNRGVMVAATHAEAIRLAVTEKGEATTSEDVKNAMEQIKNLNLDGFMSPLTMSKKDHEGGGFVRIFQVKGGSYTPASNYIQGYRQVVLKQLGL